MHTTDPEISIPGGVYAKILWRHELHILILTKAYSIDLYWALLLAYVKKKNTQYSKWSRLIFGPGLYLFCCPLCLRIREVVTQMVGWHWATATQVHWPARTTKPVLRETTWPDDHHRNILCLHSLLRVSFCLCWFRISAREWVFVYQHDL